MTTPFASVANDPHMFDDLVEVYRSVFTQPPWNETVDQVEAFRVRTPTEWLRPEARLVIARRATGEITGFATSWRTADAFPSERDWYRIVADTLGPDIVATRLAGRIEIDELAVRPEHRGLGIGRHLLREITPTNGAAAWLATSRKAEPAVELYRSAGWDEITGWTADGNEVVVFATPLTADGPTGPPSGYLA